MINSVVQYVTGSRKNTQKSKYESPFQKINDSKQKIQKTKDVMQINIQIAIGKILPYKAMAIKMSRLYKSSSNTIFSRQIKIKQIKQPQKGFPFYFQTISTKITIFTTRQFKQQNKFMFQQIQSFLVAIMAARYSIQQFSVASIKGNIQQSFQTLPLSPSLMIYSAASFFILNRYHARVTNFGSQQHNVILKSNWFQDSQNYVVDIFGIKMPFPVPLGVKLSSKSIDKIINQKREQMKLNVTQVKNIAKQIRQYYQQNKAKLASQLQSFKKIEYQYLSTPKYQKLIIQNQNHFFKVRKQISAKLKKQLQVSANMWMKVGQLSEPIKQQVNAQLKTQYIFVQKIASQFVKSQQQKSAFNNQLSEVSTIQLLKSRSYSIIKYCIFVLDVSTYIQSISIFYQADSKGKQQYYQSLYKQLSSFLSSFSQYVSSLLFDVRGFYSLQKQIMLQSLAPKITQIAKKFFNNKKYDGVSFAKVFSINISQAKQAIKNSYQQLFKNRLQLSQISIQTYQMIKNQLNQFKIKVYQSSEHQKSRIKSFVQLFIGKLHLSTVKWQLSSTLAQLVLSISQLQNSIQNLYKTIQQIKKIKDQAQRTSYVTQRTFQNTKKIVKMIQQLKQNNEKSQQIRQLKKQIQVNNNNIQLILSDRTVQQQIKNIYKQEFKPVGMSSIYDLTMNKVNENIQKQKQIVQKKISELTNIGVSSIYDLMSSQYKNKIQKQKQRISQKIQNQDVGFDDMYQNVKKKIFQSQNKYFKQINQESELQKNLQNLANNQKQKVISSLKVLNNSILYNNDLDKIFQVQQQTKKLSKYQQQIEKLFKYLQDDFNQQKLTRLLKIIKSLKQTQNKYVFMQKSQNLAQAIQRFRIKLQLMQKQIIKDPNYMVRNLKSKSIPNQSKTKKQIDINFISILKQQNKILKSAVIFLYDFFLKTINSQANFTARYLKALSSQINNKQLLQINIKGFIEASKYSYQRLIQKIVGKLWNDQKSNILGQLKHKVITKRQSFSKMNEYDRMKANFKQYDI